MCRRSVRVLCLTLEPKLEEQLLFGSLLISTAGGQRVRAHGTSPTGSNTLSGSASAHL